VCIEGIVNKVLMLVVLFVANDSGLVEFLLKFSLFLRGFHEVEHEMVLLRVLFTEHCPCTVRIHNAMSQSACFTNSLGKNMRASLVREL